MRSHAIHSSHPPLIPERAASGSGPGPAASPLPGCGRTRFFALASPSDSITSQGHLTPCMARRRHFEYSERGLLGLHVFTEEAVVFILQRNCELGLKFAWTDYGRCSASHQRETDFGLLQILGNLPATKCKPPASGALSFIGHCAEF